MVEFLEANVILIGLLMAIVEPLKLVIKSQEWYQKWMTYALAGAISLLLAVPEQGFVIDLYIAHSVGLFLISVGLYKVGEGIIAKQ
jgi:hypothetical protein